MGYGEYLAALLRPLGVYDLRENSFSGGELAALGAALDELNAYAQARQQESLVMTARDAGLSTMEALFPFLATAADIPARRAAVSGFLQISGDSFTASALSRCLTACGTVCRVSETDEAGVVRVTFPSVSGEPADFAAKKRIIESILPCHLQVRYEFAWCTWANIQSGGLTWSQAAEMTFAELAIWNMD